MKDTFMLAKSNKKYTHATLAKLDSDNHFQLFDNFDWIHYGIF